METFRVECSNCCETVETTKRTFAWPFLCDECEEAKMFQKDIAPVVNTTEMNSPLYAYDIPTRVIPVVEAREIVIEGDSQSHTMSPRRKVRYAGEEKPFQETTTEIPCSSATVENTTLLIEDLEAQVAASAKALEDANSLIKDMNETIDHWIKRVNELSTVCEEKDILMGLLVRELRERRRKI